MKQGPGIRGQGSVKTDPDAISGSPAPADPWPLTPAFQSMP
jgi:hypothetical protein